jgi:hypothetical protein
VRTALENGWESDDPASCTQDVTLRLLEQTTKLQGDDALHACEADTLEGQSVPSRVTARQIDIDGDTATAEMEVVGSSLDGQTLRVAAVKSGGRWKTDEIVGFVDLDAEKLSFEIARGVFEKVRSPAEVQVARCLLAELERFSPEKLEELIVDPSPDPLRDLVRPCAPRSEPI